MIIWLYDMVLVFSAFLFAVAGTGMAYVLMRRLQVVDVPNARSNHSVPTPRGGGLGIVFACTCFLMVVDAPGALIWGMLALAGLSLWDDFRPLPARTRLAAHAAVVVALLLTTYEGRIFGEALPLWVEMPLLALAWMWFINLFNFMDGSDGLAASEGASISLGLVALGMVLVLPAPIFSASLVVLAATLGFVVWNWHPARVFMGDVGSIPLGFVLGFLLITLAGAGFWGAALILPAVFVADATITLLRRLLNRERIFEAHSTHAYQRAIRGGMRHDTLARNVIGLNLVLIVLAVLSTGDLSVLWQGGYVLVAYLLVFALLVYFVGYRSKAAPANGISEAEVVGEIPAPANALPPAGGETTA